MRKSRLEKQIFLALCLGITVTTLPAYAAAADGPITLTEDGTSTLSEVTTESTSDNSLTDAKGIINPGYIATINGSPSLTVTSTATTGTGANSYLPSTARAITNTYGYSTYAATTINGDLTATATAHGGTTTGSSDALVAGYARVLENYANTSLVINGNAVITGTANGGTAPTGDAHAWAGGLFSPDSNANTTINGNATITATAIGGNTTTATMWGGNAYAAGIYNGYANTTTINGDTTIRATATAGTTTAATPFAEADAYGIWNTNSNNTTTLNGNVTIETTATAATGALTNEAYAYTLYNSYGSVININQASGNPYTVQLTGDIYNPTGGTINLALSNSLSFLRGNVIDNGTLNFTLANGAVWQPVYDNRNGTFYMAPGYSTSLNTISSIDLNGGIVDLTWDNAARTTARSLAITSLSGSSGAFKVASDLDSGTGDTISIGTVNTPTALSVGIVSDPLLATISSTGYYALNTGYTPITASIGSANLSLSGITTETGAVSVLPLFTNNVVSGLQVGASTNTKAAAGAANESSQLMTISNNHLRKRLGDLRDAPATENGGVWARTYSGQITNDKYQRTESDYKGFQIGCDNLEPGTTGRKYLGGALSYTTSSDTFARGDGESSAMDFAIYQTWLANDGHYYDIIAKHGWLRDNYQTTDLNNNRSTANYKTWTNSLSAEYGYRKQLTNGWYLEPQSELTFGHINAVSYTTSSDMAVKQDGIDRLIGRLGLGLGKKLENGNHIYTSLSALHEFKDQQHLTADALNYETDMSGTWGEFILGVTAKLSDHSNGYANVEKLFGADVSSNWQLNAGCRFSF